MIKIDSVQARAIQEAAKKIAKKLPAIAPGKYKGEVLARIKYDLSKGDDYDTAPTVNLLSKGVLAKALVMSGIQADNFMACLKKAAIDAMEAGDKVDIALAEEDARIEAKLEELFKQVIEKLPRQPRTGEVRCTAEIELIPEAF